LEKPGLNTHAATRICSFSDDYLTYASVSIKLDRMWSGSLYNANDQVSVELTGTKSGMNNERKHYMMGLTPTPASGGMGNPPGSGTWINGYLEVILHDRMNKGRCLDLSWESDPQTIADPSEYRIMWGNRHSGMPHGGNNTMRSIKVIDKVMTTLEFRGYPKDVYVSGYVVTDGNGMRHPRVHLSYKRPDNTEYFCMGMYKQDQSGPYSSDYSHLRCSDERKFILDSTSTSSWSGPTYVGASTLFSEDKSGGTR
jgi:hypothetical protein